MAYARHNQTSVSLVPNHQFTNFRAANPPVTFVPGQPFGVIKPCLGSAVPQMVPVNPSVVVPVRFDLNPVLIRMEEARSMSLLQFMANEGLMSSSEEEIKGENAIDTLKQVHNSKSDIDVLCVGPSFATLADDFFIVLRNILEVRSEVTEIQCVKDANSFNAVQIQWDLN